MIRKGIGSRIKISGIIELSMVDWLGKLSTVIFMTGCNMKCGYCHNYEQVQTGKWMDIDKLVNKCNNEWIDGVVISGGEPTLQSGALKLLCEELKKKKLLVKIDTNGTKPEVIKELVKDGLVDYIAIDVKCGGNKYKELTGYDGQIYKNIFQIIKICKEHNIFVECRTTYIPEIIDMDDILNIISIVKYGDIYCIQQFEPRFSYDKRFRKMKAPSKEELLYLGRGIKKYLDINIIVKGEFGNIFV